MSTRHQELDALILQMKSAAAPLRDLLHELHQRYAPLDEGQVADYIPELAKADPRGFAISVVTVAGQTFDVGDHDRLFTLQSISKPFVFGLALERHGREAVLGRVGVEPTGEAFNAIVLDEATNRPFNPMVNAGAIAATDLIDGLDFAGRIQTMLDMFERYCGRKVYVDNSVFMSERATGHRNRAIAYLMRNFGMLSERIEETLELYFQQCSLLVHCRDLAAMGATLAAGGANPLTGARALPEEFVKDVLSLMLSCGMYDAAGEWAYRVGLPAKSGVGGGIVVVVPGRLGLGVYSPPLDVKGNSVRGVRVCQELSRRFGLHVFESGFRGESLDAQLKPARSSNAAT